MLINLCSSVLAQGKLEQTADRREVPTIVEKTAKRQDVPVPTVVEKTAERHDVPVPTVVEKTAERQMLQPVAEKMADSRDAQSSSDPAQVRQEVQTVLKGKIEHSSALPPVEEQWKIGKNLSFDKLPVTGSHAVTWWRVPNWLAGTWQTQGKVKRLSIKDLEQQKTTQGFNALDIKYPDSEVIGYQQDSDGVIWTCVPTPYVGRTEQDNHLNVSIIYSAVPVSVTEEEVVIKFLATTLTVDKGSGKILSVIQRESLQIYRQIEPGKILVRASMKFFNEDGIATHESVVLSQSARIETFSETAYLPVPMAVPTLIDMRKSFDNYLRAQQLETLIPERAPLPRVKYYKIITL